MVRRKWTDHRVDIFSYGVTAYYLCAFEMPWPAGDTTGKAAMVHDSPPTDIFRYCPGLHPQLGKVIMQCMADKPEKRPESAEQIVRMLRNVERDEA